MSRLLSNSFSLLKSLSHRHGNRFLSTTSRCLSKTLDDARDITVGDSIHGFTVKKVEEVKELLLVSVLLEHDKTGAQHLHLAREDKNNAFSVMFRTTPQDSTGIPHILEHTTLCGSRKFPVKDPFFKMLSRSIANYMNAHTGQDMTLYPFCTANSQDFENLMHVYMDAVFQPYLRDTDFSQEGWRLEHSVPQDPNTPIQFKGVVYNEMKGACSNSQYRFVVAAQNNLLPSSTYGVMSGGEPMAILDLTTDQLRQFHSNNYHPSNSRFYTYGNMPLSKHLQFINENYLQNFDRIEVDTRVAPETRWEKPREAHISCPPDPMAASQDKQTTMSVNYLLNDITDIDESFTLELISTLLIDGETSPFYQALLEQNIGSDYSPNVGYSNNTREATFSVGLQGLHSDDTHRVKQIIERTLEQVTSAGFPRQRIESVIHRLEIGTKHETSQDGLHLLQEIAPVWNHDGDPVEVLQINKRISKFKDKLSDPRYLKSKVKEYFFSNPHRLTISMTPDPLYAEREQRKEEEKLAERLSQLTTDDKKLIYDRGLELLGLQDATTDLTCLPTLETRHLNPTVTKAPKQIIYVDDIPIQTCEQMTHDLVYFRAISNMASVPQELKLYIPLFTRLITKMGAGLWDFKELSEHIDMYTGGMAADIHLLQDHTNLLAYEEGVLFSSVCLARNIEKMMELWVEVFNRPNLRDKERMMTLIKITAAEIASSIAEHGAQFAIIRASSTMSPSGKYYENRRGITQARLMKRVAELTDVTHLRQHLDEIAQQVLRKTSIRFALNTSEELMDPSISAVSKFIDSMSSKGKKGSHSLLNEEPKFMPRPMKTHIKLPLSVNHVAKCIEGVPYTHADYANLRVLSKLIERKFLHKEIREKGGAYGSGANVQSGVFQLYSFRDPNVLKTLEIFDRAIDWVRLGDYTNQDVQEAIISIFQETDKPLAPGEKGKMMFLHRISDEMRQSRRDQLFAVTRDGVVDVAERYLTQGARPHSVAFLGPDNRDIKGDKSWTVIEETA